MGVIHNLEWKQQSKESGGTIHRPQRKFKPTFSFQKNMCTVFCERKGCLLVDLLSQDSTINSDVYCDTLKKLCRAVQNKQREMLAQHEMLVLNHDNARSHTTATTQHLLTTLAGNKLIARRRAVQARPRTKRGPLYRILKSFLGGRRFHDNDKVKELLICGSDHRRQL